MPRINVWIPDDLDRTLRRRLPNLNRSRVVQGALGRPARLRPRPPRVLGLRDAR